tara:strand:- start:260 stop:457 length:198 start_codon:yes stop_codon:yes gene_type:complete
MSKDKIIVEYLSQFSDLDEDDDYANYNNGRTRIFVNLDNLSDDIVERLQEYNPNSDIEILQDHIR